MNDVAAFIRRHSAPTYFALAFAVSWGALLAVVGTGGFAGTTEPGSEAMKHPGMTSPFRWPQGEPGRSASMFRSLEPRE